MTKYQGQLRKMTVVDSDPLQYYFSLGGNQPISVNTLLGQKITIRSNGKINCIACNREIKKSFQQGHCFPCTQSLAACDMCILKPETCHHHKGTCRQADWGLANCFVHHIIYLANSSGIKVGITRESQVPTRWFDQGATQALPIFRVKSRYQAGLIEVEIAKSIYDKTNWRKMLQSHPEYIDLADRRNELFAEIATDIQQIAAKFKFGDIEFLTAETVKEINYPVLVYPTKISALNLDKNPEISGTLQGIKGQYLILDTGVINLRKYTGYDLELVCG